MSGNKNELGRVDLTRFFAEKKLATAAPGPPRALRSPGGPCRRTLPVSSSRPTEFWRRGMTQDTLTRDIEVARDGAVMSAAFARPQKKNAINRPICTEAMIEGSTNRASATQKSGYCGEWQGRRVYSRETTRRFSRCRRAQAGEFPAWRFVSKVARFEKPLIAASDVLAICVGTTLCFHAISSSEHEGAVFRCRSSISASSPRAGLLASCAEAFGPRQGGGALLLAEPFGGRSGYRGLSSRPHQRYLPKRS